VITNSTLTAKAADQAAFSISGTKTRGDWENLVPVAWYRPDLRDSIPPVLYLPSGATTISPVRMCLNVLAGYDELDWRDWNLWRQGFWSLEQYEAALQANEAGREETRKRLLSAYAWEAERRMRP
jgi:hypothetical protein